MWWEFPEKEEKKKLTISNANSLFHIVLVFCGRLDIGLIAPMITLESSVDGYVIL